MGDGGSSFAGSMKQIDGDGSGGGVEDDSGGGGEK